MIRLLTILALCSLSALAQQKIEPISGKEFRAIRERLAPKKVAPWQTIRWHVDLTEARRVAVKEKKPLFLWAMNGHPLGCT